ncbi:MauE/DoxX family redox-associated membrane protein [Streptomyces werraensis]|uniref:MauE/DoxX family redox-associated membrane protein n=1 Tax=Streptomyces werraensis TaxID=68284 RepID=UPI0037FA0ABD
MAVAFAQLCLTTVLLWSGLVKFRDVSAFRQHVATTMPWLGRGLPVTLALVVPAVEVVAAGLLLIRPLAWLGCAIATALMLAFTGYLMSLLRSRPHSPCGCAGASKTPVSDVHILRNALLLTMCVLTWWATVRTSGPDLASYAVTAAPAAVIGIAVLHLGELVSFFHPPRTA